MSEKRYGVRFHTQRPTEQIEKWLDNHCRSKWNIRLGEIKVVSKGNSSKRLIVFFDNLADRKDFQKFIRNRQYGVSMFTKNSWEGIENWLRDCRLKYQDIFMGGIVEDEDGWAGKNLTVYFDSNYDKQAFNHLKTETYTHYDIRFFTRKPAASIEDWLDNNCMRKWSLGLDGMVEDAKGNIVKKLVVRFESPRDRLLFEQHYLNLVPVRAPTEPHDPLNPLLDRFIRLFA
jgi:hypothetical protein